MNAIRVFSVDDHALVREGIAMLINCQPDMLKRGKLLASAVHEAPSGPASASPALI
jgi:DNA-binding NarL/FixJ family response regulator